MKSRQTLHAAFVATNRRRSEPPANTVIATNRGVSDPSSDPAMLNLRGPGPVSERLGSASHFRT